ncbi:hypothetical protein Tco_1356693 [Tanacetum coccineum]
MTNPHPKRSFILQAVLTGTGKINTARVNVNTAGASINTVHRTINTAASTLIVNHPIPKSNAFKRGYSQSSRPFNRYYANKNSTINTNVNTARVKKTTAKDRAVVIILSRNILTLMHEVGTPRYLSLVVPLKKVGDEVVHKELGDRMERASTTASSLEAEQDSGAKIPYWGMWMLKLGLRLHLNSPIIHLSQEVTHLEVGRTV